MDPLGSAEHTLDTTGLDCPCSCREGTVKVCPFSSDNSDSGIWTTKVDLHVAFNNITPLSVDKERQKLVPSALLSTM